MQSTNESTKPDRARKGEGSVFQRRDGYWAYQIKVKGVKIVEFLGTKDEKEARRNLIAVKRRVFGEIARDEHAPATADNVTIGELLDGYIAHLEREGSRSIEVVKYTLNSNVRPAFGQMRASKLATTDLERYRERREKKVKSTTVNRDLSWLRAAMRFGQRQTPPLVRVVPHFPITREDNVRTGFLPFEGYAKILAKLPASLKPLFVCAFHASSRKGEWLSLKWSQIEGDFVRLDAGQTKTGEARLLPIYGDMGKWLARQRKVRDRDFPDTEHVFFWHEEDCRVSHGGVRVPPGSTIQDFRASWQNSVKAAGYPGLLFHDLRRTAQRNMSKAGIPREQRMKISGHKTDSMERRYNVVDLEDLKESRVRMDAWFKAQQGRRKATK